MNPLGLMCGSSYTNRRSHLPMQNRTVIDAQR
jgi:hypothetical protein